MLQDISLRFDVTNRNIKPCSKDYVLFIQAQSTLVDSNYNLPLYKEEFSKFNFYYLFNLDNKNYFFCDEEIDEYDDYKYVDKEAYLPNVSKEKRYAIITAYQFGNWIKANKYCGRCGKVNRYDHESRSLKCECGQISFPSISPAVIVLVKYGDKVLITKRHDYSKRYSLVAGYSEVGETIEQTCIREVKEETGVNIKNLKYYKSQPWSFSGSLLFGFIAELDGSAELTIDYKENVEVKWVNKKDLTIRNDDFSLTSEMFDEFIQGNI